MSQERDHKAEYQRRKEYFKTFSRARYLRSKEEAKSLSVEEEMKQARENWIRLYGRIS